MQLNTVSKQRTMAPTPLYPAENISSVSAVETLVLTVEKRDQPRNDKKRLESYWENKMVELWGGGKGVREDLGGAIVRFFTSIRQVKEGQIFPSLMKASTS